MSYELSVMGYPLWVIRYGLPVMSYQLWVISYGLSVMGYQLWVISYELSVMSYQLSVSNYGQPTTDNSQPTTANRKQKTDNRQQPTENRQQKTENRQQKTDNRKQTTDNGQPTTDNRKQKTDNGQPTTHNSQPTNKMQDSRSYKDLEIYKLGLELFFIIHPLTLQLPKYEMYELGSQLRRSADSVVSNIVEGYGRRRYKADFIRFLVFSHASCLETINHIQKIAHLYQDIEPKFQTYLEEYDKLGAKIYKFIQYVEKSWET